MSIEFHSVTTVNGTLVQVNYDNINYIIPRGNGSLITFRGGETLFIKEKLNLGYPDNCRGILEGCWPLGSGDITAGTASEIGAGF